ncbi:MAG: metallophosphoesterase [Blastocatellia bacterium]|nr:metallophosphoesterase [Blastocatellia bacterium]
MNTLKRLSLLVCLTGIFLVVGPAANWSGLTVQGQKGGPVGDFKTDVPKHDLDVVLARPTTKSVTLSMLAYKDLAVTLTYEPGGGNVPLSLKNGVPLEYEITGLEPNQAYTYTVAGEKPILNGSFRTARPAGSDFTFVMQADSHLDTNSDVKVYTTTLANMIADKPDFLVDLGDTFMTDKYPKYQDSAAQYLAQRYYFGLVGQTVPVYLTLGNHDGEAGWPVKGSAAGISEWSNMMRRKYFPQVLSNDFYTAGPLTQNYYAWNWGDALFIVLDPYHETTARPGKTLEGWAWTLGKDQYNWLRTLLENSQAPYKFVFIHHLVGGNGKDARGGAEASAFYEWGGANADGTPGFAAKRPGWPMPIHDLLRTHQVSAVFHGHDHLYVHQERDGIAYQEVPQPSFARDGAANSAAEYGYKTGTILSSSGHMRVKVAGDKATVEYVKARLTGTNAEVSDKYTLAPAREN